MIEIEEPPNTLACAPCGAPLWWLWSPRRKAWVAFVPGGAPDVLKLHGCRDLQDYATWRDLPHRVDPPAEYVEARELLKSKTQERTEEQG